MATWANVDVHCKIVKNKAVARQGIEKAAALMSALHESGGMDADQVVRRYGGDLLQGLAADGLDVGSAVGESVEAAQRSYDLAQERYRRGVHFAGVDSGFDSINRALNGICPEEMTALGGRPSLGKTTLAWEVGLTVAHQGCRVAGFPLESSKAQTGRLLTRLVGGLHAERFRKGALTEAEEAIRLDAQERVRLLPIILFDRKPIALNQLRASMLHCEARHHVDLWIVDYLQLVQSDGSDAELNQITSALRSLSLSLHAHVLLLSQLSRRPEDRNDKRPSLSDLRGSGGIEQDSVNVILLHRPGFYPELMALARKRAEQGKDPDAVEDLLRNVELIFAKTREGPTGSTPAGEVEWDADTASFRDRIRQRDRQPAHRFEEDDF